MSFSALFLATGVAIAAPNGNATTLTCNLVLPDGSQFQLDGYFDDDGLHSNHAALTQVEGVFAPRTTQEIIITTDGTNSYRWSLDNDGQKFDASLTQYGATAVLILERRVFIGRHFVRGIVGVGYCDVHRGQTSETVQ